MSKSYLDRSVLQTRGTASVQGTFGIELEIEGDLPGPGMSKHGWVGKGEGSLRSGLEYVLKKPVTLAELPKALTEIQGVINKGKPQLSIRCSTHIHVNVNKLKIREVYNVLGLYYLLEDALVATQPPTRRGNLFCLRMSDANMVALDIKNSLRKKQFFKSFNRQQHRYAALNLAAVNEFGSLEFRFLGGMINMKEVGWWCETFYRIIDVGKTKSPSQWADTYRAGGPNAILDHLTPAQKQRLLLHMSLFEIEDSMEENVESVYMIGEALQQVEGKPYRFPLNDDEGFAEDPMLEVYTLAMNQANPFFATPPPPTTETQAWAAIIDDVDDVDDVPLEPWDD